MSLCQKCRVTFAELDQLRPRHQVAAELAGDPQRDARLKAMQFSDDRAVIIDRRHPDCACEAGSVSAISPEAVADGEILIRLLVAPQHIDGAGQPQATSLRDAELSGLSLLREDQATDDEIRSTAEQLVTNARRANNLKAGVIGVLRMQTATVRSSRAPEEARGGFCIYDAAEASRPSHAEAFQRMAGTGKPLARARRHVLFENVKASFLPVDTFRGGLLKHLGPKS